MRELSRVVPLLLLSSLAGCDRVPRIEIHGQEARLSPMFRRTCSIFLTIDNPGTGGDVLVDARVDAPGAVAEIHGVEDGRMVRRRKVGVPAHGVVEFKPGGMHIMVFNLPRDVAAGAELTLRLEFEKSGEKSTSVKLSM